MKAVRTLQYKQANGEGKIQQTNYSSKHWMRITSTEVAPHDNCLMSNTNLPRVYKLMHAGIRTIALIRPKCNSLKMYNVICQKTNQG